MHSSQGQRQKYKKTHTMKQSPQAKSQMEECNSRKDISNQNMQQQENQHNKCDNYNQNSAKHKFHAGVNKVKSSLALMGNHHNFNHNQSINKGKLNNLNRQKNQSTDHNNNNITMQQQYQSNQKQNNQQEEEDMNSDVNLQNIKNVRKIRQLNLKRNDNEYFLRFDGKVDNYDNSDEINPKMLIKGNKNNFNDKNLNFSKNSGDFLKVLQKFQFHARQMTPEERMQEQMYSEKLTFKSNFGKEEKPEKQFYYRRNSCYCHKCGDITRYAMKIHKTIVFRDKIQNIKQHMIQEVKRLLGRNQIIKNQQQQQQVQQQILKEKIFFQNQKNQQLTRRQSSSQKGKIKIQQGNSVFSTKDHYKCVNVNTPKSSIADGNSNKDKVSSHTDLNGFPKMKQNNNTVKPKSSFSMLTNQYLNINTKVDQNLNKSHQPSPSKQQEQMGLDSKTPKANIYNFHSSLPNNTDIDSSYNKKSNIKFEQNNALQEINEFQNKNDKELEFDDQQLQLQKNQSNNNQSSSNDLQNSNNSQKISRNSQKKDSNFTDMAASKQSKKLNQFLRKKSQDKLNNSGNLNNSPGFKVNQDFTISSVESENGEKDPEFKKVEEQLKLLKRIFKLEEKHRESIYSEETLKELKQQLSIKINETTKQKMSALKKFKQTANMMMIGKRMEKDQEFYNKYYYILNKIDNEDYNAEYEKVKTPKAIQIPTYKKSKNKFQKAGMKAKNFMGYFKINHSPKQGQITSLGQQLNNNRIKGIASMSPRTNNLYSQINIKNDETNDEKINNGRQSITLMNFKPIQSNLIQNYQQKERANTSGEQKYSILQNSNVQTVSQNTLETPDKQIFSLNLVASNSKQEILLKEHKKQKKSLMSLKQMTKKFKMNDSNKIEKKKSVVSLSKKISIKNLPKLDVQPYIGYNISTQPSTTKAQNNQNLISPLKSARNTSNKSKRKVTNDNLEGNLLSHRSNKQQSLTHSDFYKNGNAEYCKSDRIMKQSFQQNQIKQIRSGGQSPKNSNHDFHKSYRGFISSNKSGIKQYQNQDNYDNYYNSSGKNKNHKLQK